MIYKNIEIHNAVDVYQEEGYEGVRWLRVPRKVKEQFEMELAQKHASGYTGVELRFVMKSEKVILRLAKVNPKEKRGHQMHVFYGGIQGGWQEHEINRILEQDVEEIVISKPKNMDVLKKVAEHMNDGWDPEVVRVILDNGHYRLIDVIGDVMPPNREQTPEKVLLTYGSSITHGSNCFDSSHSWASLLAYHLKMDLRNLGFAGSCAMEPAIVDYIAAEGEAGRWNMAVCELGINVAEWEEEKIYQRVRNTIRQIAGRNTDKKVYIISPFYCNYDYHGQPYAERWRRIIGEIVTEFDYANVIYINGLDLLGDVSLLSADEVHPSIYGVQRIADELKRRVQEGNRQA